MLQSVVLTPFAADWCVYGLCMECTAREGSRYRVP